MRLAPITPRLSGWPLAPAAVVMAAALVVAGAAGCGSTGGRYPVEGRLTLGSAAIPDTVVTFLPRDGGEPGAATTDADGRFVVSTREKQGLVPGLYDVVVEVVPPPTDDPDVERPGRQPSRPPKPAVPGRYGSRETSRLSIEVRPERNAVSLDLENR